MRMTPPAEQVEDDPENYDLAWLMSFVKPFMTPFRGPNNLLVGLDKLTFHAFTSYLNAFSNSVTKRCDPSNEAVVLQSTEGEDEGGKRNQRTVVICLGPCSYSAAHSSLSRLYTEFGVIKDFSENSWYLWRQVPQCQQ